MHGVIVAIKDVISFRGHQLTAASAILKNFEAIYTATALQYLIDEEAIIIGNCNCDEFAMGSSNENSHYGPVLNALDESRVPGGSSGGSAVAVQAGMCMISLGSDTGGSVRQPAGFCGADVRRVANAPVAAQVRSLHQRRGAPPPADRPVGGGRVGAVAGWPGAAPEPRCRRRCVHPGRAGGGCRLAGQRGCRSAGRSGCPGALHPVAAPGAGSLSSWLRACGDRPRPAGTPCRSTGKAGAADTQRSMLVTPAARSAAFITLEPP